MTGITAYNLAGDSRFRRMPGCRVYQHDKNHVVRVYRKMDKGEWVESCGQADTQDQAVVESQGFPDLNDAATIGTIEGQARAICPGLIMFPPQKPGESYAIGRDALTCLASAKTLGECWALAFLEVCK